MKKLLVFLTSILLITGNMAVPDRALSQIDDYNLVALQYQLNKAREELSRLLSIQSKDMKKELERLKREIDRIYKEIEDEMKKAQITIQEEDRNLKQYLVKYKFEVEQMKVEIDTSMKIEKVKTNAEGEVSKFDISQANGQWKKITTENAPAGRAKSSPNPVAPVATASTAKAPVSENAKPTTPEPQPNREAKSKEESPSKEEIHAAEVKLSQFGGEIAKNKKALSARSGSQRDLWISLAKAHLEAERFLRTLDVRERHKFIHSDDYILGSYEVAILALKRALTPNANNPDLNYLLGEVYDEVNDGLSASNHAEVARLQYIKQGNGKQAAKAEEFARSMKKKYGIGKESSCRPTVILC